MKVIDSSCHVEGIGNVRYEVHIDMRGLRRQIGKALPIAKDLP